MPTKLTITHGSNSKGVIMIKYYSTEHIDELKEKGIVTSQPLDWQKRGLQQTATGYGRKIATQYVLKDPNDKKTRRVYAICYSNCASLYIIKGKEELFIHS